MAKVKIMCAGDSLTLGSSPYRGSYRRHLLNMAPNLYPVGSQLNAGANLGYAPHEGYGGGQVPTRSGDILSAIDTHVPEVVLIWFGTNEVTDGSYSAEQDRDFLYAFAVNCLNKSSVSTVIVGTCAPRRSDDALYATQNAYRDLVNTHFQTTQAPLPSGMYHCDPGAVIDSDSYFGDQLHLTDAGYQLVAPVWYAALQSAGVALSRGTQDAGDVI